MDLQVALPVFATYRRWVALYPSGTGNKPLLCLFTDLFYWRALERFFRVGIALLRKMTHQPTVFAGLFRLAIHIK